MKKEINNKTRETGKPPYCNTGVQNTKKGFMEGFVTIDTLYLHLKYPSRDIFDKYYRYVSDVDTRILREGCVVGDFVIKNGSSGYKISVWQHDARVYLTDQVDEKCGENKGMGIWIQLGPKFLLENIYDLQNGVYDFLYEIGIDETYPMTITRIDAAIDCLGLAMRDQDLIYWINGWVGRSNVSKIYFKPRTRLPQSIYVGSRKSPIFLRVYDKVAQSISDGDDKYWLDIWKNYDGSVTRIEWEVKPKDGNFSDDLKNFNDFNDFSIRELVNYLLDWGRLCIPNPSDSNRNRWEESPLWVELRKLVTKWSNGVDWPTSRFGKEFHGISPAYVKFLSGTISGGIAKLNPNDPSMEGLFEGLSEYGETLEIIQRIAELKAQRIKRL